MGGCIILRLEILPEHAIRRSWRQNKETTTQISVRKLYKRIENEAQDNNYEWVREEIRGMARNLKWIISWQRRNQVLEVLRDCSYYEQNNLLEVKLWRRTKESRVNEYGNVRMDHHIKNTTKISWMKTIQKYTSPRYKNYAVCSIF